MRDGSRGIGYSEVITTHPDSVPHDFNSEWRTVARESSSCDETIYVFAPIEYIDQLKNVMDKTGFCYRINDYRVWKWNEQQVICFFHEAGLNEYQQVVLASARAQQVQVESLTSYLERRQGYVEVELLDFEQLLSIEPVLDKAQIVRWQRRFDVSVAAVLLVMLALPSLLVAALIKLDSKGPVFFRQQRTGLYNREFAIIKFRSMCQFAEKEGARWACRNDIRITRIGRFIRKTRIDEWPQLINVLRGEMSLIGPRPEREVFIRELEQHVPFYRFRHLVKPGITGLAQVMDGYGASIEDAKAKHRYDLYYIKHRSVKLSLKILWKTVLIVVTGKGV